MSDNASFFYERIKTLVKSQQKVTLQAFIEEVGINYNSYTSARQYGNILRGDECVKIAQALNVSVEYLVTGQTTENAQKLQKIKNALLELADEVDTIQ
ncbi:MAG: helix-turn-helix transcriptional regulator [Treponema phagedenis]|uniref:helix-turn-helix domain-containing protein n=1 Tax=Treponema phagedenis TaxID=162 RepID=UPI0004664D74|nr:helix-turn-helix transcriptional regulator [Treponema phagedenis]QEJ95314.1 helix-turn-helix transcriptional regulator [Treponema phagedenis]QEK01168.1 helix-turn-helix transcriptional regulator [Treponema phagedenis]TYT79787.1 helix-turn-helix transcriptional regulator [Treponema phagedenis]